MRVPALSLSVALILAVSSCRDAAAPDTVGLRAVGVPRNDLVVAPIAGIVAVNKQGTRVTTVGFGAVNIRTPWNGTLDVSLTPFNGWSIDENDVVFGKGTFSIVYWLPGQNPVSVALNLGTESTNFVWGRQLSSGEVIMAVSTYDDTQPNGYFWRLYRWSSVTGYTYINDHTSSIGLHGITASGGIVWSEYEASTGNRMYRANLDNSAMSYDVSPFTLSSAVAGRGSIGNMVIAVDDLGRLVGRGTIGGMQYPVLWSANGSPVLLDVPNPQFGYDGADAIDGDYVSGVYSTSASFSVPARWHWNGSTWDFEPYTFAGAVGNPSITRINASGVLAVGYANPAGYLFGAQGHSEHHASAAVLSDGFLFVDNASRIWMPDGVLTPTPVVTTPGTIYATQGIRFTLPLTLEHPAGNGAGPFDFKVRWQNGVSTATQTGSWPSIDGNEPLRHTYATAGTNEVRLIVTDVNGNADTAFTSMEVVAAEAAPEAALTAEADPVAEGDDVVLDASASTDPNALGLTYRWRFDGVGAGQEAVMTRRNVLRGDHTWRVIVTNEAGLADTLSGTVDVFNQPPRARLVAPKAPIGEGIPFQLTAANVVDAQIDLSSVQFRFDCGTGYGDWQLAATINCPGLPDNGSFTVGVKLTDQASGTRTYTAPLTGRNRAPTVTIDFFEYRPDNGGQYRVHFTIGDVAGDGQFSTGVKVNGTRITGTKLTGHNAVTIWFYAQGTDVITVRVLDKDGAAGEASGSPIT